MRILVSYRVRNLRGLHRRTAQKPFGFFHPHRSQILNKCLSHLLAENRAEMIRAQVHAGRHSIQGNILIIKMLLNIVPGILQQRPVFLTRRFFPQINDRLKYLFKIFFCLFYC